MTINNKRVVSKIRALAHDPNLDRVTAVEVLGKGAGHRARLNVGDTCAYACAVDCDEPLVFVGQGFAHTDVRTVDGRS